MFDQLLNDISFFLKGCDGYSKIFERFMQCIKMMKNPCKSRDALPTITGKKRKGRGETNKFFTQLPPAKKMKFQKESKEDIADANNFFPSQPPVNKCSGDCHPKLSNAHTSPS